MERTAVVLLVSKQEKNSHPGTMKWKTSRAQKKQQSDWSIQIMQNLDWLVQNIEVLWLANLKNAFDFIGWCCQCFMHSFSLVNLSLLCFGPWILVLWNFAKSAIGLSVALIVMYFGAKEA